MPRPKRDKSISPVRFRLTWAGAVFLAISLLLCAGAVNNQAPLLLLLFGAMMGVLHISAVLARRTVSAVDLRRDVPGRVWQNQTVHLGYYLSHRRRRGSLLGLEVMEIAPRGIEAAPAYCVHLGSRGLFRAGGRFAARLRGRIRMNKVRLSTSFPFGLVSARREFARPADVVIWPARGKLKARLLQLGAAETSRAAPSPATGGQDEFFGLREYRMGDNPRWIHWKRSAIRSTPVVREMARPLPEVLMVVLDTFGRGAAPERNAAREKMIRFAGTLIDTALSRGYLVGLALAGAGGGVYHRPAAGRGQLCTLLDALADVPPAVERPIEESLACVEPAAVRGAIVAVLSLDDNWLPGGAGTALPFSCRRLLVIHPRDLDTIYEDDPLAESEAPPGGSASAEGARAEARPQAKPKSETRNPKP